ncbi:MAG TPA: hypothetical protein VGM98_00455 [Schlesneria sp.]|jgi:hypothetical protein
MAFAKLKFVGPSIGIQNIDLGYVVDGTNDYEEARVTMFATAPPLLGLFMPVDFRLQPLDGAEDLWDGTITYGPRTNNSPDGQNDPTYTFDLTVEKTRVMQSLQTVGRYGIRATTDYKRNINVQDDGTVEGVDLNFGVFSWTETHYLANSTVDRAFFFLLFNLVARMNISPFRDFQRGEVLFLGCNGSKRYTADDWEMQFKFIASPNAANLKVGPDITVTEKLGHDYLWCTYETSVDTSSKAITRIPKNVFIERVYEFADLNSMRLVNPLAL